MLESNEALVEKGDPETTSLPSRFAGAGQMSKGFWNFIRPSFFTRGAWAYDNRKLRKTAYLDGLRGLAAFSVYWLHHELWSHGMAMRIFENWYGWDDRHYFVCLPFIRLFFTGGHFGVACFYVISGYVLSVKSLSLLQNGKLAELGDTLASALFRRWLRLYIPVIGTTFVYMVFWHVTGMKPENPMAQSNLYDEFWWWYPQLKNYSFVFKDGGFPWTDYNFHSWSIPMEFRGSIIIFTALQAFATCTRNARLWCDLVLMFYFFYVVDAWYGAAFMAGMMLCDMHLLAEKGRLPMARLFRALDKKIVYITLIIVGLFLGGAPSNDTEIETVRSNPWGWYYLSYLAPGAMKDPKWAFMVPAAVMIVIAIPRLPWLKAFFETRFIQYLGRISFSLYLVHGPVLWILGDRLYAATGMVRPFHDTHLPQWIDKFKLPGGPLGLEFCFLAPHIILMPFTFWLAEITTKVFDEPSVRVTAWLYKKVLE